MSCFLTISVLYAMKSYWQMAISSVDFLDTLAPKLGHFCPKVRAQSPTLHNQQSKYVKTLQGGGNFIESQSIHDRQHALSSKKNAISNGFHCFLYFYCSYVVFSYDLRILRNKKFLTISLTRGNKTTLLSRNDLLFIMCVNGMLQDQKLINKGSYYCQQLSGGSNTFSRLKNPWEGFCTKRQIASLLRTT